MFLDSRHSLQGIMFAMKTGIEKMVAVRIFGVLRKSIKIARLL